jgi:alkanesulfonate monooxygenase SsuD/methylene tetrahydromethanopterin reductase-like flavin-dependent oxidoreductase (luciferase family)
VLVSSTELKKQALAAASASTMNSIAENLERVREQISQAAAEAGRAIDEIELVAILKDHDAEKVLEA